MYGQQPVKAERFDLVAVLKNARLRPIQNSINMSLPTIYENPNGLHQRYIVEKANGKPVDPSAIYFVLRLDNGGSDHKHIKACREAAKAYITALRQQNHLPDLADDLAIILLNNQ